MQDRFLSDLQAGLPDRDICLVGRGDALLTVTVWNDGPSVFLRVLDPGTRSLRTRTLDISKLPRDTRSLAIAVASEELIRSLIPQPAFDADSGRDSEVDETDLGVAEEPSASSVQPSHSTSRKPGRPVELGLAFATDGFAGGVVLLGPQATLHVDLLSRWGVDLAVDYREGLEATSSLGRVGVRAAGGQLGLTWAAWSDRRWVIRVASLAMLRWIRFEGRPGSDAEGDSGSGLMGGAQGAVAFRWSATRRLGLRALVGLGGSFASAEATAAESPVTGTDGIWVNGALGVDWRL
ncbi:MAG: hypothetical protein ACFB9M_04930 [Myxococcota bacterium]